MKALIPSYYEQFQCIGSSCEDTCCRGWKVTIDEKTFKKYKKLKKSPIQQQVQQAIKRNRSQATASNHGSIKLTEKGCPLMTAEGLCGIQAELGSDYLSRTCSVYPREKQIVEGTLEMSLTISCPEAARLALRNPDGINFHEIEHSPDQWDEQLKSKVYPHLWAIRIAAIRLLQNRTTSLENRLIILGLFLQKLTTTSPLTNESIEAIAATYEQRLSFAPFIEQLKQLTPQHLFQLRLISKVSNERQSFKSNARFYSCIQQVTEHLQFNEDLPDADKVAIYQQAITASYEPFIQEHSYLLENYLVNHVFKEVFPYDEQDFFTSYQKMVTYFILIKFHLIGMSHRPEPLTVDEALVLFQSFSRTTEHNKGYVKKALQVLTEEDMTSFGRLVTLIQH